MSEIKRFLFAFSIVFFMTVNIYSASPVEVPVIETKFAAEHLKNINIKQSVIKGCHKTNWSVQDAAGNIVTAKYEVRKHEVIVDIFIYEDGYKIEYKDSKNMDYKPENPEGGKIYTHGYERGPYKIIPKEATIHRNYAKMGRKS